jgi:hypothetical protein
VVDGITLERLGVPAAVVACDLLINSTGKATARLQGAPNLPFVVLPVGPGAPIQDLSPEELRARVIEAADQIAGILLADEL